MLFLDNQIRKQIFREELHALLQSHFISEEDYSKISTVYSNYHRQNETAQKPPEAQNPPQAQKPQSVKNIRKVPDPQVVRDRNITWVLTLGVILVLMAGLILATSNWSEMGAFGKTSMISLATLLFFGVSWLSGEKMKIRRTSFAFWVLGCLFLPVSILSAGFFELFGSWLSISGDGRYILGLIGAAVCIPVYTYSTFKYHARFYSWMSLITMSIGVLFLISALQPAKDAFYLCIILYNGLLLLGNMKLKGVDKLKPFTKELLLFTQINLTMGTLFTLMLFDNAAFNGFNVIVTAILYAAMVYTQKKRGYVFVFMGLLVYGIYQLSENTSLKQFDVLVFALLSIVFIGIERIKKSDIWLTKIYRFSNGVISFFAFIFISIRATDMSEAGSISLPLLLAYIILAFTYVYLSYKTQKMVFAILAPIFMLAVANQSYELLHPYLGNEGYPVYMFIASLIIFTGLFFFNNNWRVVKRLKGSSAIVSMVAMFACISYEIFESNYTLAYIMAFVIGCAFYSIHKKYTSKMLKISMQAGMAVSWFAAAAMTYTDIEHILHTNYEMVVHFGISVLVLFGLSLLWKRLNKELEPAFFWIAQAFIPIAVLLLSEKHNANPLIYLIPAGIYVYSMFRYKHEIPARIFLYLSFLMGTMATYAFFRLLDLDSGWDKYTIFVPSCIIAALWALLRNKWRSRVAHYFLPSAILGIFVITLHSSNTLLDIAAAILLLVIVFYILHKEGLANLALIPLFVLGVITASFNEIILNSSRIEPFYLMLPWLILFFVLTIIGKTVFTDLAGRNKETNQIRLDWYSAFAFLFLLPAFIYSEAHNLHPGLLELIPYTLLPVFLFVQIKRVGEKSTNRRMAKTLFIIGFLFPYYKLLSLLSIPSVIETEMAILPLIALCTVIRKKVWKEYASIMRNVEGIILIFAAVCLLNDVVAHHYLADALILGVLSLASVLWGFQTRVKSFFFVGGISLLANVLFQTREFWSSIPWWGYLLAAGLILIAVASLNEMQKNKPENEKVSAKKVAEKFKGWN